MIKTIRMSISVYFRHSDFLLCHLNKVAKRKEKINIANNSRIYPYVFLNFQFRCRIHYTTNKEVGLSDAIWLYLLSNLIQVSKTQQFCLSHLWYSWNNFKCLRHPLFSFFKSDWAKSVIKWKYDQTRYINDIVKIFY